MCILTKVKTNIYSLADTIKLSIKLSRHIGHVENNYPFDCVSDPFCNQYR